MDEDMNFPKYPEKTDYWEDRFKIFVYVCPQIRGFVLDVGCGVGGFAVLSALKGWKTYFCDYQPRKVRVTSSEFKERSLGGEGVVADARCLPFRRDIFDLVSCIEVLEHVGAEMERGENVICWILRK